MIRLGTIIFSESADTLCVTVPWMSPELLESIRPGSNVRPSCESDCYAFGMLIHEVLTGRPPFGELSVLQVTLTVARKDARKDLPARVPEASLTTSGT